MTNGIERRGDEHNPDPEERRFAKVRATIEDLADNGLPAKDGERTFYKAWKAVPSDVRDIVAHAVVEAQELSGEQEVIKKADAEGVSFFITTYENTDNPFNSTHATMAAQPFYRRESSRGAGSEIERIRNAEAALDNVKLQLAMRATKNRVDRHVAAGNIKPGIGMSFGLTASAMRLANAAYNATSPRKA